MRVVCVVGPTAAGKTGLAIRIAKAADAEIVSADSQQVYRGMDIGTGKATAAERAEVPHHLLDVANPDEPMTAARYVELADAAVAEIAARGKSVVLCGGTGLYVRAFLYGLFPGPAADAAIRERLAREARDVGVPALWDRLAAVDPVAATKIDRNDLVRITRALEVHELTGRPISEHQAQHDFTRLPRRHDARLIGLNPPDLRARIEARVDAMLAAGLVDEVRALNAAGYGCNLRAFAAIGYREVCAHLRGELRPPPPEARAHLRGDLRPAPLEAGAADALRWAIGQATRKYARRQVVWFRADPTVAWYTSAADVDVGEVAAWLRGPPVPGGKKP